MAKDDVYETTFDPKQWTFRSCCKGHALVAGDKITVSSPNQMYGGKTVITECPVCRGERADKYHTELLRRLTLASIAFLRLPGDVDDDDVVKKLVDATNAARDSLGLRADRFNPVT